MKEIGNSVAVSLVSLVIDREVPSRCIVLFGNKPVFTKASPFKLWLAFHGIQLVFLPSPEMNGKLSLIYEEPTAERHNIEPLHVYLSPIINEITNMKPLKSPQ